MGRPLRSAPGNFVYHVLNRATDACRCLSMLATIPPLRACWLKVVSGSPCAAAPIRVRGLKQPFEELVDLTSDLEDAPQQPSESDSVNQ
jgi:hypothetical protein